MCSHWQGRSRTPGSLWTPSQGRSRPRSQQRPGMGCVPPAHCSTSAAHVRLSSPPSPCGSHGVLGCPTASMGAAAIQSDLCDCCQQQALLSLWKWQKSGESGFLQQHTVMLGSVLPVCWGWHCLRAGSSRGVSISPPHSRHRPHGTQ